MSEPLVVNSRITIDAPAPQVWDALVNPEQTKKYMFGCETVSDWTPGSTLEWKMQHEGKDFIPVKGHVVDIKHGEYLAYTVIDPHNPNIPDAPENYLTVTYELVEHDDITTLNVTQGDYSKVADGENRYKEAHNNGEGWNPILQQIKTIVETGSQAS